MPLPLIPIILGAIAAGTAAKGVHSGAKAISKNKEARETSELAQNIYDNAVLELETARVNTDNALQALGRAKLNVLDKSMTRFVDVYGMLKNVEWSDSVGLNELKNFVIDAQTLTTMREMGSMAASMLGGVVGGGVAGGLAAFGAFGAATTFGAASTGTAIAALSGAAAKSATLAFLGGGALSVGGLGMAGGAAVLGGVVAGPAIAVLGAVMHAKANKNLDNANANLAEARKHRDEYSLATTVCNGISARARMFTDLIGRLERLFNPLISEMVSIINRHGTDFSQYDMDSKGVIARACATALAVKKVLDTPILTESGALTTQSETVHREVSGFVSAQNTTSNKQSSSITYEEWLKLRGAVDTPGFREVFEYEMRAK